MSGHSSSTTVGPLPDTTAESPFVPVALTWLVWSLLAASIAALALRVRGGGAWEVPGLVAVDGLTVLMWVVVTFFSGIVHSYSRRYMAGSAHETRFFATMFGFTVVVMGLVAADHLALFGVLWLAMGLLMATLIGTVSGWEQAQAAATVARRHFLASSALLGVALTALWWTTGATTVSGIAGAADTLGGPVWLVAAGALVLAAMIQSALVPFHTWLLSSMTAPTPASALMHAGFVNAGGILLTRFAPVITVDPALMLAVVAVGGASAIGGKLLKSVQPDIKSKLGCSTVGQMGFMLMQAGLGFFGAAITHLILHGFYKAYQFLSAGGQVEHTGPSERTPHTTGPLPSVAGGVVTVLTGLAGGVLFAALTGKGTSVDSSLLLTVFVVFTTLHAARSTVQHTSLPRAARYAAVPLVFLPAIVVYAVVYGAVSGLLSGLPMVAVPTELTLLHGILAAIFVGIYVAIETGVHEHSQRLYVALLNASQPSPDSVLTSTEDYNEY
ncbi:proton-conducting transporter transmembrane domain-containing protein [Haloglomus halophilum]|uniref:proton-conducting transporter transmembrane domain-containing protein n=1 Tax=Haloglomus halophilum TaxID=2962672 RepID=UPI0020C9884B|nr:proton-conducting transporter membrane subunit [Haloglomus halophilum]